MAEQWKIEDETGILAQGKTSQAKSPARQLGSLLPSTDSKALAAVMKAPSTANTKSLAKASLDLKAWDTINDPPPIGEEEAEREALLGGSETIEPGKAVEIATRIANSFPHLSSKDEDALAGYITDLADVIARHHPLTVQEVTAGPDRIQLKTKWAPSAAELKDELNDVAHRMFPNVQRARLALAWHAARALSKPEFDAITRSTRWHYCLKAKAGDRALALVREHMEAS